MNIPNCTECGACCCHHDPRWIKVAEEEKATLPLDYVHLSAMRMQKERCIAFRGFVGVQTKCLIYDERPNACRSVQPGSPLCLYMLGYHSLKVIP